MLVYDDATARDAALPSPSDGMVVGLEESGVLSRRINGSWRDGLVGGKVIVVHPSDDYDTDTANIQSAIDELTTTKLGKDPGTVLLVGGLYKINAPLIFGPSDPNDGTDDKNPPRMMGMTTAHIRAASTMSTDEYMIVYSGLHRGYEIGPYLSNLMLWPTGYCRGVRVHQATYAQALRDVHIRLAVKVGLDWIDCWGAELRNISVSNMDGIAIRTQGGGSILLDHVEWRGGSVTDWPAVDEELFKNYDGDWVQTTDEERAGLIIKSSLCTGRHLIPESYESGDYPAIYIGANNANLTDIRFESCVNNDCRIRVADAEQVTLFNMTAGDSGNKYVVRATGTCKGIRLSQVYAVASVGILCCDGGTHSGHHVSGVVYPETRFYGPYNYIIERNNPTMSGVPSAHDSNTVAMPWQ